MINRLKKSNAGFTIIELLVVIAIISVLSAIAIPQYTAYKTRAYDISALADAKNCYTSIQAYLADNPSVSADAVLLSDAVLNGFMETAGVTTLIVLGEITSSHSNGSATYTVALNGVISKS